MKIVFGKPPENDSFQPTVEGWKPLKEPKNMLELQLVSILIGMLLAWDIRALLKEHARYRHIQIALKNYDADQILLELHSAIGTLETEEAEGPLEALIQFLEKHKKGLMDYRKWLREQGVDTTGMRPMGSAEATMSVFAKRLKNGRSWSEKGLYD